MSFASSVATGDRHPRTACFSVVAEASPGMLPRVLELFAKRDLVVTRCEAAHDGGQLVIELEMDGMEAPLAEYIGRCMGQIFGVAGVAVSTSGARNRQRAA